MGPSFSHTSIYSSDKSGKQIQAGSDYISELIRENKYNILGNFHGHVHDSQGLYTFHNVRIVNDGPLKQGQYSFVHLQNQNNNWIIQNVEFK